MTAASGGDIPTRFYSRAAGERYRQLEDQRFAQLAAMPAGAREIYIAKCADFGIYAPAEVAFWSYVFGLDLPRPN